MKRNLQIRLFPGEIPAGWLECDGSVIDEARHPGLARLMRRQAPELIDGEDVRLPDMREGCATAWAMGHLAVPHVGAARESP